MKFYNEITSGLIKFFGLDTEASESEVHQALTDAIEGKTPKGISLSDAGITPDKLAQIKGFEATIQTSDSKLSAAESQIEALQTELEGLKAQISGKDDEIKKLADQVTDLSAKLAEAKVSTPAGNQPIPTTKEAISEGEKDQPKNKGGISNQQFMEVFGFN